MLRIILILLSFLLTNPLVAKDVAPREQISVSGKLNDKVPTKFDVSFLEKLKVTQVELLDPYQKNLSFKFEGILLEDLFEYFSVNAVKVKVIAINNYEIEINRSEKRNKQLLFTFKENSKYIPVSNMGPLRIVRTGLGKISEQELILEGRDWVWMVKELVFE